MKKKTMMIMMLFAAAGLMLLPGCEKSIDGAAAEKLLTGMKLPDGTPVGLTSIKCPKSTPAKIGTKMSCTGMVGPDEIGIDGEVKTAEGFVDFLLKSKVASSKEFESKMVAAGKPVTCEPKIFVVKTPSPTFTCQLGDQKIRVGVDAEGGWDVKADGAPAAHAETRRRRTLRPRIPRPPKKNTSRPSPPHAPATLAGTLRRISSNRRPPASISRFFFALRARHGGCNEAARRSCI